jgi:hypothetical protein
VHLETPARLLNGVKWIPAAAAAGSGAITVGADFSRFGHNIYALLNLFCEMKNGDANGLEHCSFLAFCLPFFSFLIFLLLFLQSPSPHHHPS